MNKVKIIDGLPNTSKLFIDGVEIQGLVEYQVSSGVNEPRKLKLEILVDNMEVDVLDKAEIKAKEFAKYVKEYNKRFTVSAV